MFHNSLKIHQCEGIYLLQKNIQITEKIFCFESCKLTKNGRENYTAYTLL